MEGAGRKSLSLFPLPHSTFLLISDLSFQWIRAFALRDRAATLTTIPVAMPVLSHELLITAVELVCYFCTAIGVAITFLFAART